MQRNCAHYGMPTWPSTLRVVAFSHPERRCFHVFSVHSVVGYPLMHMCMHIYINERLQLHVY
jgi:hypothetical protein